MSIPCNSRGQEVQKRSTFGANSCMRYTLTHMYILLVGECCALLASGSDQTEGSARCAVDVRGTD